MYEDGIIHLIASAVGLYWIIAGIVWLLKKISE